MMIKRGSYYVRRDGSVVGPAHPNDLRGKTAFPWLVGGIGYTDDGKFFASGKEDGHDLVAEAAEPPMVPRYTLTIPALPRVEDDPRDLKIADAYQVIGNLLSACGTFETDEGQRALDYFGISEEYDPEFLPWPRTPLPHAGGAAGDRSAAPLAERLASADLLDAILPLITDLKTLDRMGGCREAISRAEVAVASAVGRGISPQSFADRERELLAANARIEKRASEAEEKIAELIGLITSGADAQAGDTAARPAGAVSPWDCFAAHALAGILSCFRDYRDDGGSHEGRATLAARFGDLMMAERAKRGLQ